MYGDDDTSWNEPEPPLDNVETTTIRVIAPATLAEGYTFDVTVEVPRGGVKEGQEFEVLYEPHIYGEGGPKHSVTRRRSSTSRRSSVSRRKSQATDPELGPSGTLPMKSSSEEEEDKRLRRTKSGEENEKEDDQNTWYDETTGAPIGRWRTSLCSCCDVLTQSTFWMGLCCTPVLIAQLVTRMGANCPFALPCLLLGCIEAYRIAHETRNANTGWDGNYNGKRAIEGTYFYRITAQDCRDLLVPRAGALTLLR